MQSVNICIACWQGNYVNGVCTNCHHPAADSDRRPDALPPLEVVHGRYFIGQVLGKGGFGITYSAWDNAQMRRVALKELFPSISVTRDPDGRSVVANEGHERYFAELKDKFREEALRPRQLARECNAVQVYDLFSCNNTVYYAMEYLEGCDLRQYQKEHGLLTWTFLAPLMRQLLRTLELLHQENLIHRDISPDNIFLTRDGQVKLIDFGAARAYQGTLNFTVLKKANFAPWEQMESTGNQGPWTDLYALSVTMYMLLSGKLPPKAQDRIQGKQVTPLSTLCPGLPQHVAAAIEKGMNIKIQDRFQSARDYAQALFPAARPDPAKPPRPITREAAPRTQTHPQPQPQPAPQAQTRLQPKRVYWLRGTRGCYAGQKKQLATGALVQFGRQPGCDIPFPESTPGVSRSQCALFLDGTGRVFLKDTGSSYGTFLSGEKVGRDWLRVTPGDTIHFGNEEFLLMCQM